MAVDTRNKRFSLLGFAQARGMPLVFPNPDGTLNSDDRAHFVYLYPGISIVSGQPTMQRFGGVPHMKYGPRAFGRSW